MRRAIGLLLIGGLVPTWPAAGASAAVLYSQAEIPADQPGVISNNFGSLSTMNSEGADDFTVPAGQRWQIESIDVLGSSNFAGDESANVRIYADAGAVPAGTAFSQSSVPISGNNDFSVALSGAPQLGSGAYWISFQTNASSGWEYDAGTTPVGQTAVWRNPGNGYGTGCTSFAPITGCGFGVARSFLFRLNGSIVPPAPLATGRKRKKCKRGRKRKARKKCRKKRKKKGRLSVPGTPRPAG